MNTIIVTLLEGDHILGAGALVNSLYKHGYRGTVYVGYRGSLSGWAHAATLDDGYLEFRPAQGLRMRFIPVQPGWHLTNLKAWFMLDVLERLEPSSEAVVYFDPDIVVKCRWSFYEEWMGYGVALCHEAVMGNMPSDHPLRCFWSKWADQRGWPTVRKAEGAMNGGFVGVRREQASALRLWHAIIEEMGKEAPLDKFGPGDRSKPFIMTDQDALNILTMVYEGDLSRIGPEGMDFEGGGFTMSHAAGGVKPWRKRYLRSALNGIAPTLADKGWAGNLDAPIQVLPSTKVKGIQRSIHVASAIGRFIRRS